MAVAYLDGPTIGAMRADENFTTFRFDPEQIASLVDAFVATGSQLNCMSVRDVIIHGNYSGDPNDPWPGRPLSMAEAVDQGQKFFPTMYYASLGGFVPGPRGRWEVVMSENRDPGDVGPHTMDDLAHVFTVIAFFLVTRANLPSEPVPRFVRAILGMRYRTEDYVRMVCDGPPERMPRDWIRFLTYRNMGHEMLSRFGLGVAGARAFAPFKCLARPADLDAVLEEPYLTACELANRVNTWEIHPVTRDPTILTTFGPLNANLNNLARLVFSPESLARLAADRIIFQLPPIDPRVRNYVGWHRGLLQRQWTPIDFQ